MSKRAKPIAGETGKGYQGMSLRNPFFFLLLDSFLLLGSEELLGFAEEPVAGAVVAPAAEELSVAALEPDAGAPVSVVDALPPEVLLVLLEEDPAETVSTATELPLPDPPVPTDPGAPEPGLSTSVADVGSLGGFRFGWPVRAAMETSGPVFKTPSDRCMMPGRLRGSFCSCSIRARAPGSDCGTGTPARRSLFLESPTRLESG